MPPKERIRLERMWVALALYIHEFWILHIAQIQGVCLRQKRRTTCASWRWGNWKPCILGIVLCYCDKCSRLSPLNILNSRQWVNKPQPGPSTIPWWPGLYSSWLTFFQQAGYLLDLESRGGANRIKGERVNSGSWYWQKDTISDTRTLTSLTQKGS